LEEKKTIFEPIIDSKVEDKSHGKLLEH